ncbi:two-component system, OmpR family, sensor histidine kinase MtrB [Paramicrobacterium humi]|uniref:Sensor histidine kinase MtrB n=1 Tax=Paramicrobacterium humi TaxID=640635 RepID=A0A1H4P3S9_9MICO|nr:MtrAB system histidine kinase MtrB [Microbacterium humi]SEC01994.1 two-component system, OmpR family, sensor histidine kinase MtrB [Microbacterium humi]
MSLLTQLSGRAATGMRTWLHRLRELWRRSLRFRTVSITMCLTLVAVLASGVYMSLSVRNDLFASRLAQVLDDSSRTMNSVQRLFDSADINDRVAITAVMNTVRNQLAATSSSQLIAGYRAPGQEYSPYAPQGFRSSELAGGVLTSQLRETVQEGTGKQWWQSVTLTGDQGEAPGVIVGQLVDVPGAGQYEFYIGFDLTDSEQTLTFLQQTMLIVGLSLLLLVGAVAWVVVRLVVKPITVAAETSQRLAAGELEVRMRESGDDELATLARSFNGMAGSLQQRIRELAELSLVQQRFVSDVSHELRTPLTTIRLADDVIYDQRHSFPPATTRTAELLHTQVERFDLLLNDLLEISRYDAGSVQLELEPTNLANLAADCIEGMEALAAERGSDIRLVAPGGHGDVEMDPRRIRRIVRNLLGNAIEHGESKPIVVTVDSDAESVSLAVRDYGLGMSEFDVEHVFDRFWRADPSRRRTIGGTGLGLSISTEDAALHGGILDVWSRPGEGSNFRLTLPRSPGEPVSSFPLPLVPPDADGSAALGRTEDA